MSNNNRRNAEVTGKKGSFVFMAPAALAATTVMPTFTLPFPCRIITFAVRSCAGGSTPTGTWDLKYHATAYGSLASICTTPTGPAGSTSAGTEYAQTVTPTDTVRGGLLAVVHTKSAGANVPISTIEIGYETLEG